MEGEKRNKQTKEMKNCNVNYWFKKKYGAKCLTFFMITIKLNQFLPVLPIPDIMLCLYKLHHHMVMLYISSISSVQYALKTPGLV